MWYMGEAIVTLVNEGLEASSSTENQRYDEHDQEDEE
jgi:hypothetical protein